jgi:Protein of unknown function (DUF2569)/GYF domain 2
MSGFWYYAEGTETRGPITFDQLVKALSLLPTPRGVLVWREGFDDWTAAENVREIAVRLIRPPPLPLRPTRSPVATPREAAADQEESDTVARYQQQFRKDKSLDEGPDHTVKRYQQQFQKVKPELTPQSELTGLGGWLGLLGFGLVTGILRTLVKTGQSWSEVDSRIFQQFPLASYGGLILDVVWFVLFIYTIALFFNKSRKFKPFFIWFLIAGMLVPLVSIAWIRITIPSNNIGVGNMFGSEEVAQMIVSFIGAVLWIPYILKSRRVANTFVN